MTRKRLITSAALSLGVLLTACAGGDQPEVVLSTSQEVTANAVSVSATGPAAAWADDGALQLVTWGSGSCPKLPASVASDGADQVRVETTEWHPPGSNGCTSDPSPTTSTVRVPDGVDVTGPVTVTIDGQPVALPPAP